MSKSDKSAKALQRVETLLELGRHAEAGRVASQVITTDPRNGRAWALKAQSLLGQSRYEQTLAAARAASTVAPEAEYPHRLASVALSNLGRNHEAAASAKAAIERAPDHWATHYLYGQTLLSMDSLDEAQASAERAVALAPKRAETHVGLGAVAAAQRRRDVAENSLRRALALDPSNTAAQTRLDALGSRPRAKGMTGSTPDQGGSVTHAPVCSEAQEGLERRVGRSLSRIAYLISLVAALIIRMQGRGGVGVSVLLLTIPLLYVALFVTRLAPEDRQYLFQLVGRRSTLRIAVVLEALAIVLALGGGAVPTARVTLSGVAIAAAVVARLLVFVARRQTARESGSQAAGGIGNAALLRLGLIVLVVGIGVVHQAMSGGTS